MDTAFATPQFWLLWFVLFLNVTAGIGLIEQASPMIQEMFPQSFRPPAGALAAGGFVGLLSLFNMAGRFFWSSTSDYIGRKSTYSIFFLLGAAFYAALTFTSEKHLNSVPLFVLGSVIILSMYGGGFATIPAYLRDMFGTMNVSAIHGRLLTAWSAAGVAGPLIVNYLREVQLRHGVQLADAYSVVMYVMAALLVAGFFCNMAVRPVSDHYLRGDRSDQFAPPAARVLSASFLQRKLE